MPRRVSQDVCSKCAKNVSEFTFENVTAASPPRKRAVYVIRVKKAGKALAKIRDEERRFVSRLHASMFGNPYRDSIKRLAKMRANCPVLYIGYAAGPKGRRHTLDRRYKELCSVHPASKPIVALLRGGWELEFGWRLEKEPQIAEDELKEQYKKNHSGCLPALMLR